MIHIGGVPQIWCLCSGGAGTTSLHPGPPTRLAKNTFACLCQEPSLTLSRRLSMLSMVLKLAGKYFVAPMLIWKFNVWPTSFIWMTLYSVVCGAEWTYQSWLGIWLSGAGHFQKSFKLLPSESLYIYMSLRQNKAKQKKSKEFNVAKYSLQSHWNTCSSAKRVPDNLDQIKGCTGICGSLIYICIALLALYLHCLTW